MQVLRVGQPLMMSSHPSTGISPFFSQLSPSSTMSGTAADLSSFPPPFHPQWPCSPRPLQMSQSRNSKPRNPPLTNHPSFGTHPSTFIPTPMFNPSFVAVKSPPQIKSTFPQLNASFQVTDFAKLYPYRYNCRT